MLIHLLLSTAVLMGVAYVVPGIEVASLLSAFIAACVLGLVNVIIRPILLLLTLPITIVTLGLFSLVINALMGAIILMLVNWLVYCLDQGDKATVIK
jgi:putative membrane protein